MDYYVFVGKKNGERGKDEKENNINNTQSECCGEAKRLGKVRGQEC